MNKTVMKKLENFTKKNLEKRLFCSKTMLIGTNRVKHCYSNAIFW